MAVTISHFRFGIDELAESTHGWYANEDTNPAQGVIAVNTTFLLRFKIQCTAGSSAANCAPTWQVQKNTGGWVSLTTTSANAKTVTPTCWANAASTTSRLTGSGAFDTSNAGCTADGTAGGPTMDIAADGNNETECAIQIVGADVTAGDSIQFRVLNGAGVFDSYPGTQAAITVGAASQQLSGSSASSLWAAAAIALVAGTVALSGAAPSTAWTVPTLALTQTTALSGSAPATTWTVPSLILAPGSVALSGGVPAVSWNASSLNLAVGSVALSGSAASASWQGATLTLTGSTALSGTAPSATWAVPTLSLTLEGGPQALSGQAAQTVWSLPTLALEAGTAPLTGAAASVGWQVPTLALGGGAVPQALSGAIPAVAWTVAGLSLAGGPAALTGTAPGATWSVPALTLSAMTWPTLRVTVQPVTRVQLAVTPAVSIELDNV